MSIVARTLRNAAATLALTALAGAAFAQDPSTAEPASEASPLAVLQTILSNPTDLDFVKQYTTDDFTYVSLNYEHPELAKRWLLGTHHGAVRPKHLQHYLDEFVFRFNRGGPGNLHSGMSGLSA
jgi:hypothetical protein